MPFQAFSNEMTSIFFNPSYGKIECVLRNGGLSLSGYSSCSLGDSSVAIDASHLFEETLEAIAIHDLVIVAKKGKLMYGDDLIPLP